MSADVVNEEVPESGSLESLPRAEAVRLLPLLALIAITAGLLLRVFQYVVNRSLWLDEALLSRSILTRGFSELAEPLLHGQTAPLGFLYLVRGSVEVLGSSEFALRLVPLVAGLAALIGFGMLARRWLPDTEAVLATALFSLAPFLIYYSSEVKQYSMDVLATVLLLLLTRRILDSDGDDIWRLTSIALTGAVVVWLSHPAIFLLASIGLVLLVRAIGTREKSSVWHVIAVGTCWLTSFYASYSVANRGLADREYMEAFWRGGFWPFPPGSVADLAWLPQAFVRMLREPIGILSDNPIHSLPIVIGGGITLLLGAILAYRRERLWGLVCLLPFGLVLSASVARMYPFGGQFLTGGRVLLFLLPIAFLWVAEGAGAILARSRPLGMVLVAMIIAPYTLYAIQSVPHLRGELKPLLSYVQEEWQPGDRLYVHNDGRAQFAYYEERYGFQSRDVILGGCSRFQPGRYLEEIAALSGSPRLWVLFVGDKNGPQRFSEKDLILTGLDRLGRRLDDQVAIGTSVYLYDLRGADISALNGIPVPNLPYELAFDCRGPWAHD